VIKYTGKLQHPSEFIGIVGSQNRLHHWLNMIKHPLAWDFKHQFACGLGMWMCPAGCKN